MEDNGPQFDANLGGEERLPHTISGLRFAAARSIEVAAMTESILRPSKTKLVFQTLPVHMRRRVMSHNCKRLPRRLRVAHLSQMKKSGLPPKQKRPSRKYRRRPNNLLKEYNRRQRENIWLESHIWHAKRFHMINRWGYRLARAPCDKAFRACYRAGSAHCLLQDISYHMCLEVKGDLNNMKIAFAKITSPDCGLGICAKAFTSGFREGCADFFQPNKYPNNYIGKVNFVWNSTVGENEGTIWLFVHPAFYDEFSIAMVNSFQLILKMNDSVKKGIDNDEEPHTKKIKISLDSKKTKKDTKSKQFINESGILVSELKSPLNRFRLTGPKSHAVIYNTLKVINNSNEVAEEHWMTKSLEKDLNLPDKNDYWKKLKYVNSPSELPSHMVLNLVVKDPRVTRPPKRTKATNTKENDTDVICLLTVPACSSTTVLWDESIRTKISKSKLSSAKLIKYATENQLVPGEVHQENPDVQPVPIMLIQRPGSQNCSKKLGYNSGWDIIMPSGYALPFWLSLILCGARAGGLRETENLHFEGGHEYMPPDTKAGQIEEQRIYNECKDKFFRLPPNKRVNHIKYAINSPFLCHWRTLLKDWSLQISDEFYVLRNKSVLKKLQESIDNNKLNPDLDAELSCLIPVSIKIKNKGNLSRFALICLPVSQDLKQVPLEEETPDKNKAKRKKMRKVHKIELKRLRRQRLKKKKLGQKAQQTDRNQKGLKNPKNIEYMLKMRELWLPSKVDNVRHQCSRDVMGYVTHGAFSYTEACSCAIGYVTYNSFIALMKNKQKSISEVLVRNTTSRQYRFAKLNIIL